MSTSSDSVYVEDNLKWGLLVKSWATGRNYFCGDDPIPVPKTLDEVKQQAEDLGIGLKVGKNITGLAIVNYSEEVLTIKIPPKSMVERREAEINVNGYPLPSFYDDFYAEFANADPLDIGPAERRLDFHACRIGDYSVRNCG